jgi:hypothetical protein
VNIGKLAIVTVVMAFAAKYVSAEELTLTGGSTPIQVGMAFDQGLSAVIQYDDRYHMTIGNDGMAFDVHFIEGEFNKEIPFTWYVGTGGWYEWDQDFGLRVPLGLTYNFGQYWDLYGQVQPEWQLQEKAQLQFGASIGLTYNF